MGGRLSAHAKSIDAVGATPLRVFGVAKTVSRCFKYRNRIGRDVAVESTLKVRRKKATPAGDRRFREDRSGGSEIEKRPVTYL